MEKIIEIKGRTATALPNLVKQVIKAAQKGYKPKDNFDNINDCRMYNNSWFRVVLEKGSEASGEAYVEEISEDVTPSVDVKITESTEPLRSFEKENKKSNEELLKEFENITKKKDMLAWAEDNGIEVPEDVKYPAAVKAHIEKALK